MPGVTVPQGSDVWAVEPGDIIADKYEVEGVLGSGGMGVVVSVRHVELGRRFAVKLLSTEAMAMPEIAARFTREARAAVKLHGEHVVSVVDVGKLANGCPYMVMEHLEGHDLREELASRGPLPTDEAVDYVLQACEALAEAHAAGVVHRDVKPANLFLARRPDHSPLIKVVDFGISKVALSDGPEEISLTATRTLLGSPQYMAPEQVRSARSVDHRVDIWGLGVTLYELLSQATPFLGETVTAVAAAIVADAPIPLREYNPDVPAELESVVMRCLEKDRERRYQDIGELVDALATVAPEHSMASARRAARISGRTLPNRASSARVVVDTDAARANSTDWDAETVADAEVARVQTDAADTAAETVADTAADLVPEQRADARRRWPIALAVVAVLILAGVALHAAFGSKEPATAAPEQHPSPTAARRPGDGRGGGVGVRRPPGAARCARGGYEPRRAIAPEAPARSGAQDGRARAGARAGASPRSRRSLTRTRDQARLCPALRSQIASRGPPSRRSP
jgi:hypothetical protein